jgi:hypothetical protein
MQKMLHNFTNRIAPNAKNLKPCKTFTLHTLRRCQKDEGKYNGTKAAYRMLVKLTLDLKQLEMRMKNNQIVRRKSSYSSSQTTTLQYFHKTGFDLSAS